MLLLPTSMTEKAFYMLLIDAIGLAQESEEHGHQRAKRMFARASILNGAMLIECTANICLASKNLSGTGTPLQRLQTYCAAAGSKPIDVTRAEVQAVEELRRVRNQLVHLRTATHPMQEPSEDPDSLAEVHPETSSRLTLSAMSALWSSEDAVRVLAALRAFLSYYFIDLLRLSPKRTYHLLATEVRSEQGDGHVEDSLIDACYSYSLQKWGLDFRFLGSQSDA
jgi:hypothetical protein